MLPLDGQAWPPPRGCVDGELANPRGHLWTQARLDYVVRMRIPSGLRRGLSDVVPMRKPRGLRLVRRGFEDSLPVQWPELEGCRNFGVWCLEAEDGQLGIAVDEASARRDELPYSDVYVFLAETGDHLDLFRRKAT